MPEVLGLPESCTGSAFWIQLPDRREAGGRECRRVHRAKALRVEREGEEG